MALFRFRATKVDTRRSRLLAFFFVWAVLLGTFGSLGGVRGTPQRSGVSVFECRLGTVVSLLVTAVSQ